MWVPQHVEQGYLQAIDLNILLELASVGEDVLTLNRVEVPG